jgi:LysM repeat protein
MVLVASGHHMRLPDKGGKLRSFDMMDDFDEAMAPEEESSRGSKVGVIAVFIGIVGIIVGLTGIILANKAQNEMKALEARLAAKPDKSSEIEGQIASLNDRLETLGSEFVKLGRQDRQIQDNTQVAFNEVSGNVRANREALNELGTKMTELVEKLENWKPTTRVATQSVPTTQTTSTDAGSETAEPAAAGESIYSIQSGDTLSKVAKEFGVSLSALMAANPTVNPNRLQIGQPIVIPQP